MKVKRILHIIGGMNRAGAETMIMNLFRKIDRNNYQFDFLYFTEDACDYDEEIESLGGIIYRIPICNSIKRTIAIYNLLRNNKTFYAVHGHTLFSNGFHMLAAYFSKCERRIVHSHSTSDVNDNSFLGRLYHDFSRFLINVLGTKFVACGEQASHYLFYKNKEIIQLPNAIDINYFNKCGINYKSNLRKELGKDESYIIISQVGTLSYVKNHIFSINLAEKLKAKGVNFHMVFAGRGPLNGDLIQIRKECGVVDDISFLGIRDDIFLVLAGSDVMLMPSHYEGLPVVLVESQSTGIPSIVSTNVSSEVDLGVGKVFFKPLDDIDAWIELIENVKKIKSIDNNKRISTLSKKGFDINQSIKLLDEIYV